MLADVFLSRVSPAQLEVFLAHDDLEATLRTVLDQARAEWDGVDVDGPTYVAYLADRLPSSGSLAAMETADLYLACALCHRVPSAVEVLERSILDKLRPPLAKFDKGSDLTDEVLQQLRTNLLTPQGDGAPQVSQFTGKGSLKGWLHVSAVRLAIGYQRKANKEVALDERLMQVPGDGTELLVLRERYKHHFKSAFQDALKSLSAEERTILKMTVIDGVTGTQLAAVRGVHRSTAVRWISAARTTLADRTKELLRERIEVPQDELESIIRMVRSRIDVSLERILNPAEIPSS
jgi:RNA polymerase sigma-70 factor (ECF subfamily)